MLSYVGPTSVRCAMTQKPSFLKWFKCETKMQQHETSENLEFNVQENSNKTPGSDQREEENSSGSTALLKSRIISQQTYGSWFSPKMHRFFSSCWVPSRSDHVLTTNELLWSSFQTTSCLVRFWCDPECKTNCTKEENELWSDSAEIIEAGVKAPLKNTE